MWWGVEGVRRIQKGAKDLLKFLISVDEAKTPELVSSPPSLSHSMFSLMHTQVCDEEGDCENEQISFFKENVDRTARFMQAITIANYNIRK
jgi:hypothetical protein